MKSTINAFDKRFLLPSMTYTDVFDFYLRIKKNEKNFIATKNYDKKWKFSCFLRAPVETKTTNLNGNVKVYTLSLDKSSKVHSFIFNIYRTYYKISTASLVKTTFCNNNKTK